MTGPTHVAIATVATIGLAAAGGPTPAGLGWLAVIIGSLAPDIDGGGYIARPGSLLGRLLPRWVARLLDAIGMTISNVVRSIFGHRGALHWPVWGMILMLLGVNSGQLWLAWFGWGYVWHILGDFCTVSGVPLLGPLSTKDIKWSPIRTGTWGEALVSTPLWLLILWQGRNFIPPQAWVWVDKFVDSFSAIFL